MCGKYVFWFIEVLVEEVKNFVCFGVKELMFIVQELIYYGLDIYKKCEFFCLFYVFVDVEGIEWICLYYVYFSKFFMEIFDVMVECFEICNYFDMFLQYVNNVVFDCMCW